MKLKFVEEKKLVYHYKSQCDKCNARPIVGSRYKCGHCSDYDLCEVCFKTYDSFHNKNHVFLKLKKDTLIESDKPLIKKEFYQVNLLNSGIPLGVTVPEKIVISRK